MNVPTGSGFVEVDGSYGEGGGQLLRTAVALSAITSRPVRIKAIRAGRENPGLQAQHLKGVEAVAALCDAKLQGAHMRSTELTFEPAEIKPRSLTVDVGTAGAVTLVLQALTLAAARSPGTTTVDLTGGTHVSWSPPVDYFRDIFCHHLRSIGVEVTLKLLKHGFYPKGGGRVDVEIRGSRDWRALDIGNPATVDRITVRSVASVDLKIARVAERQHDGFRSVIPEVVIEETSYVPSLSTGSAISAQAVCGVTRLGSDALGKRGVRAEQVGQEAARNLKAEIDSGASLDVHAADMMLPYLALASRSSRFAVRELTGHINSVQWLVRQFVDVDFGVERKGNLHVISVNPNSSGA